MIVVELIYRIYSRISGLRFLYELNIYEIMIHPNVVNVSQLINALKERRTRFKHRNLQFLIDGCLSYTV